MVSNINHPTHYNNNAPFECIDLAELYSFNMGNAIKYVWRHQYKHNPMDDLEKALWYLHRSQQQGEPLTPVQKNDYPQAKKMIHTLIDYNYAGAFEFWDSLLSSDSIEKVIESVEILIERLPS